MKKDLCVLWELDEESTARFEELSRVFIGSPFLCTSFYPHITLGCYKDISSSLLDSYVRRFAKKAVSFCVQFEEIGLLNPQQPVCLPKFSGKLRELYTLFHRRFDSYADEWTSQSGGLYTPHVSLAYRDDALNPAAAIRLMDSFSPFESQVTALCLSWLKGEEDYQIIATYPLIGKS